MVDESIGFRVKGGCFASDLSHDARTASGDSQVNDVILILSGKVSSVLTPQTGNGSS